MSTTINWAALIYLLIGTGMIVVALYGQKKNNVVLTQIGIVTSCVFLTNLFSKDLSFGVGVAVSALVIGWINIMLHLIKRVLNNGVA